MFILREEKCNSNLQVIPSINECIIYKVVKCETCGLATALSPEACMNINNYQFTPEEQDEITEINDNPQLPKYELKQNDSMPNQETNLGNEVPLYQQDNKSLSNQANYPQLSLNADSGNMLRLNSNQDSPLVIQRCSLHLCITNGES